MASTTAFRLPLLSAHVEPLPLSGAHLFRATSTTDFHGWTSFPSIHLILPTSKQNIPRILSYLPTLVQVQSELL
jgi:hypothetical protein